ncbi:MAG: LicD family protein [Bacteroides sp.]|nr:LicD family protein [Bacteroides sp.]
MKQELKYVRNNLKNEYGILELQDKILEIMVYIDDFCKKYKIDYCLMAGSALGARRHNGFIPWDDDIDIYMTARDYMKFRKRFNQYGDKNGYYLQEWGKTNWHGRHMVTMAKLRMNDTEIQERAFIGWKMHQGIFVDIFIIHGCPDNVISQKVQYLWAEAVVLKGLCEKGYVSKGIKDSILLGIAKLVPKKWLLRHGLYNVYKYDIQKTKFGSGFMDTRKFDRAVYPKNVIFPTKYVPFENVQLKVPANNDEYLRIQFGDDYMTIPDEDKREVNKHALTWSCYKKSKGTDYSDEQKLI